MSGCVFEGNDNLAIRMDPDSHHNSVTGNTVARGPFDTVCLGIEICGADNLINSNVIAATKGPGLHLSGANHSASGNRITSESGTDCVLIENLTGSIVRDNRLSGVSGGSASTGRVAYRGTNGGNSVRDNL
jgi:hypothetical protein